MNRRRFLVRTGAAVFGLALARTMPGIGGEVPYVPDPLTAAWESRMLKAGDVFTIEVIYVVNPVTREEVLYGCRGLKGYHY